MQYYYLIRVDLRMSNKYEKFAVDTFQTVHDEISKSHHQGALLVFVGEEHAPNNIQERFKSRIGSEDYEPNTASIYAQISAIQSAILIAGKENAVLSMEMNEETLARTTEIIRSNNNQVPDNFKTIPSFHTLAFALREGISVEASDPFADQPSHPERDKLINQAISSLADSKGEDVGQENPFIVVHVGGFRHMNNMQGYSDQDVLAAKGDLVYNKDNSPFSGIFNEQVYFNTVRLPELVMDIFNQQVSKGAGRYHPSIDHGIADQNYTTNKQNAIQIDAPGEMDHDDITQAHLRIKATSQPPEPVQEEVSLSEQLIDNSVSVFNK